LDDSKPSNECGTGERGKDGKARIKWRNRLKKGNEGWLKGDGKSVSLFFLD
jgi:hypothetical protein